MVGTAVTGTTPVGSTLSPTSAFKNRGLAALELTDVSNAGAPVGYPFDHRPRIGSNLLGTKLFG
jgi:hypothetical protein